MQCSAMQVDPAELENLYKQHIIEKDKSWDGKSGDCKAKLQKIFLSYKGVFKMFMHECWVFEIFYSVQNPSSSN